MNTYDLINKVEVINIMCGNDGLFVWFVGHNCGGIGRHYSSTRVNWNVVPGFNGCAEMEDALYKLEEKYEIVGRTSP